MYKGIDYGRGQTNINHESGIRFGVIPQHDVLQAWADTSEANYGECEEHGDDCPDDCMLMEEAEPISFCVDDGEYLAECDDSGDIFITKSPFFTYAQFCSPCAPGACHLRNPVDPDPNNKCYCLGHDWFEDEAAPYPIYSVKTGELVTA